MMAEKKDQEEQNKIPVDDVKDLTDNEEIVEVEKKGYDSFVELYDMFVKGVKFSLLSPRLAKKISNVKVVTPELYDNEGYPVDGGLMDTKMGVIDPGLRCRTCGGSVKECLGHFGYVELARPVLHIKLAGLIYKILKSTCKFCGKALLPAEQIEIFREQFEDAMKNRGISQARKELKRMFASIKGAIKCPQCNLKNNKILFEKPYTFYDDELKLTPIEIRARLEKIPDDHLFLFGLNPASSRPEWGILTLLPVPPVTTRPSITLETGERSEDDLTHKLGDIVRINQRLFENINAGAPEIIIEDLWQLLQYHTATLYDNGIAQLPVARHRSGQPLKSIVGRIKAKEGRLRHTLAGKRVNFSSRTVISPDPMINFNEVGVPQEIAQNLSVPMRVTDWNIEFSKGFIENSSTKYPGANYVIRPDGVRKRITNETKEQLLEELQPGYIVERHLLDGDVVLFNRQPSLHKLSLMAHKVKVLPGKTFRINPSVCNPYNADFDGDEMNLHVPQTEEAQAEALLLLQVPYNVISPKNGLAVISNIQDGISGNYLLSRYLTLTRKEAVELLGSVGITDFSRLPDKKLIEGKEVYSCVFPKGFDFEGKTKVYKQKGDEENPDALIKIKDGKITQGFLDKKTLGGLLVRRLHKLFGEEKTIDFLHLVNKIGIKVTTQFGFTVSIGDVTISDEVSKQIESTLNTSLLEAQKAVKDYQEGKLDTHPGKTPEESLESMLLEKLNKARNDAGEILLNNFDKVTDLKMMIDSGARGNTINMAQMSGCVGQQDLRGQRISFGYSDRTLSYFKKNDLSYRPRGFIKSNFTNGLDPDEFFFLAITGRDSLMDKGLTTPTSGYLYRRMANSFQDIKVEKDSTVRDSAGNIIQFDFGDDGLDVSKTEGGKINVSSIIDEVLLNK
jgi:DNA-directed RNA polymerase subunit A'